MESIRTAMQTEAENLKKIVDEVTFENIDKTHIIEKSLLEMLESQESRFDEYIVYLEKLLKKICQKMATETFEICYSKTIEQLRIQRNKIPEKIKPLEPVFTPRQCSKEDVLKLLGNIEFDHTKEDNREIKAENINLTQLKCTEKPLEQSKEKSDIKNTLSLSSSVTKVREYIVPGVAKAFHVSVDKSGRLWVSDWSRNLVQTDLKGNLQQRIKTNGREEGYHTATQEGNLIYTDQYKNMIYLIATDRKITEFQNTGDWNPYSVHSSRINDDILVGMIKSGKAKVTRYNKIGKEIQNIQRDNKGHKLYRYPYYITENINGDICTSDSNKRAVVVVNKSGLHRFSYTGQGSEFRPWGICTDVLGHILVCDSSRKSVHLLDQDGGFLSFILSPQQGVKHPRGVCVDDENNLYVGQFGSNTVTVYKYLY